MRTPVLIAALLYSAAAIAQSNDPASPTTTPSAPPAAKPSATVTTPSTSAGQPTWYKGQQGEWRSSKLIGTKVRNNAGENIGDINDVLLSKDGKAQAVVIGVGGFLGMGEREVAVDFNSLQMRQESNGTTVVMLDASKDTLKSAPVWIWQRS